MLEKENIVSDSEYEMYRILDEVYEETGIELWQFQHTIQCLKLERNAEFKKLMEDSKLKPKLICTGLGILKQSRRSVQ